jgi:large subunit ribosomal protein L1
MAPVSKKRRAIQEALRDVQALPVDSALVKLKELASAKFDETVEVCINLGVDPRKSDQTVRGSTVLPHGTGKTITVAVFAQGEKAEAAKRAGADIVGFDDLVESIKGGQLNFDVVIATPDAMRVVGQLGQILGPRGLMPNPKVGTVTNDVSTAVINAKGGQVRYRADKAGIVHCPIGKISFDATALQENLMALLADLQKARPSTAKGIYLRKITISSTMGPGITIDRASVAV